MAQFPAIAPDERGYTLGEPPVTEFRGEGGVAVRFRQGTIFVGQALSLPYTNRPKAQIESIWDHYYGQQSATFTLPSTVWCAHTGGDGMADAALVWRYASPPEVDRNSAGRYSMTVQLEAVGVSIAGTAADSLQTSDDLLTVVGIGVPALPARPLPVPDPVIQPPVTVTVPDTSAVVPAGEVVAGAGVTLRWSSAGIPDTGEVLIGSEVELRYGSGALLEPGEVTVGEAATLETGTL
jgi:hypothetical protein